MEFLPLLLFALVILWLISRQSKKSLGATRAPRDVGPASPTASSQRPSPRKYSTLAAVRHWDDEGEEVEVVGESRNRKAIAAIAGNSDEHADKHCKAFLVPEDDNKHDAEAVAVVIEGRRVGYLSRDDASAFRERLVDEGMPGAITSCSAHICWGGEGESGERLHYSITLTLSLFNERL